LRTRSNSKREETSSDDEDKEDSAHSEDIDAEAVKQATPKAAVPILA
jgi:hypothetical protein